MREAVPMSKAMYRTAVSDKDLPKTVKLTFGEETVTYHKAPWSMRYGTNPHQPAALYFPEGDVLWDMRILKSGKNGLSSTNVEDGYRALRVVGYFDEPTAAVMKHLNPSGVGIALDGQDITDAFEKAWSGDPMSAFGGVIGTNRPVDEQLARSIVDYDKNIPDNEKKFVECLFAPSVTPEALDVFEKSSRSKNMRVVEVPRAKEILDKGLQYELRVIGDSILLESRFYNKFRSLADIEKLVKESNGITGVVTDRYPTEQELPDLRYAWCVCGEKRSNGVDLWKCDKTLGVGTGQQNRIDAIKMALDCAERFGHDTRGAVLASDGFMLWDNVDPLIEAGVTAIIQPGGSDSDKLLKQKCNESGISMVFTGERIFRHF